MGGPSDRELVSLVRGGDASALESLFERHYQAVYRLAYRWCGVREDAEDVAQEVFVKLVRKISTFEGKSSFRTWLYRIVVNAAVDQRRRGSAARSRHEAYAGEQGLHNPAPVAPNPCTSGKLAAAVERLPQKQKAALLLVFGEGLTHREAGHVLGCPEVSVSWRIFQARRKLRKMLEFPL